MASQAFQHAVSTSAVQATTITGLTALTTTSSGVRITIPGDNTGKVYFGFGVGLTTSNGELIPNGTPFTINPGEFPTNADGKPDLTALYFIASASGQTITGRVLL